MSDDWNRYTSLRGIKSDHFQLLDNRPVKPFPVANFIAAVVCVGMAAVVLVVVLRGF